jgi:hypothetical protein
VAALAFWQRSSDQAVATDPPAMTSMAPAAQAQAEPVAPLPPVTEAAPVVPATAPASVAARKPASGRVTRRVPPAAVTVERKDPVVPSAPDVDTMPAPRPTYEQRVADAASLAAEDSDRALLALQLLTADQPSRPEAYAAQAAIRLRQRDYRQAGELLETALLYGGKATFSLIHDHDRGNFDAKNPCIGELSIDAGEVKFEAPGEKDRFTASWTDVRDVGANKFFGSGVGGFHVVVTDQGKRRNFNLAPASRDKAEAKLILDLLSANARRADRGR